MRLPTYAELRRFCEVEGWEDRDRAAHRPKGDHHRYVLTLAAGATLYTRVSHGAGSIQSRDMWAHILRDQLEVTADEFWACVDKGILPPRPSPESPTPSEGLPAGLVWQLIRKAGMSEGDVARMTKEQAVAAWDRFLEEGG